jgi:hypothetical protein
MSEEKHSVSTLAEKGVYIAVVNFIGKLGLRESARLEEKLVINDSSAVVFSLYPFPYCILD